MFCNNVPKIHEKVFAFESILYKKNYHCSSQIHNEISWNDEHYNKTKSWKIDGKKHEVNFVNVFTHQESEMKGYKYLLTIETHTFFLHSNI